MAPRRPDNEPRLGEKPTLSVKSFGRPRPSFTDAFFDTLFEGFFFSLEPPFWSQKDDRLQGQLFSHFLVYLLRGVSGGGGVAGTLLTG